MEITLQTISPFTYEGTCLLPSIPCQVKYDIAFMKWPNKIMEQTGHTRPETSGAVGWRGLAFLLQEHPWVPRPWVASAVATSMENRTMSTGRIWQRPRTPATKPLFCRKLSTGSRMTRFWSRRLGSGTFSFVLQADLKWKLCLLRCEVSCRLFDWSIAFQCHQKSFHW